jgi:hypothetical protein
MKDMKYIPPVTGVIPNIDKSMTVQRMQEIYELIAQSNFQIINILYEKIHNLENKGGEYTKGVIKSDNDRLIQIVKNNWKTALN